MELWTGGNATDPIWRVLASSDGISSSTPLKPQHSNPNHNPNPLAKQLWSIDFLLPSQTSHHPSQTPCFPWISYATHKPMLDSCKMVKKQSEAFHTFLWHFFSKFKTILLHIVLLKCPHIQIAFLKFTSYDNQASNSFCSCWFEPEIIKIGQSSHNMYSNKILNFQESSTILNACPKKVWKLIEGTT